MSQSPTSRAPTKNYIKGWAQVMILVQSHGLSLSGREANCCFLNTGETQFANVSTVSGLDFIDDARGCGVVDWDKDGDLDLWVSNRTAPQARYLRNDLQTSGNFISLKLQGTKSNRDAVGARVTVKFNDDPKIHIKTLHAGEGFLSQSTKRIHFGVADRERIDELSVRWPDGSVEAFADLQSNRFYKIVQGQDCQTQTFDREALAELSPSIVRPPTPPVSRTVVAPREDAMKIKWLDRQGSVVARKDIAQGPMLINLWSETCGPCIEELVEFASAARQLQAAKLKVIPIRSFNEGEDAKTTTRNLAKFAAKLSLPFDLYAATEATMLRLTDAQNEVLQINQELVLPTSFLLDGEGRLSVIYRGQITPELVLSDVERLSQQADQWSELAVPFPGWWHDSPLAEKPR